MEGGDIDFDPLSAEGQEDINDTVDDEYESLLQQRDETPRGWHKRISTKFGSNTKFAISRIRDLFKTKNPRNSVPVYLQMKEDYKTSDYTTPQYDMIAEITHGLKEKRPNVDLSQLEFKVNEKGRVMVKHVTGKTWYFLYHSKTGDILKSMPQNIKDALGDPPLITQKESLEEREQIEMNEFKSAMDDAILDADTSFEESQELEKKKAEIMALKEYILEAEKFFAKQNEETIKAQKRADVFTNERIQSLIESRDYDRKEYKKLKGKYDTMKKFKRN